ncbi:MAG: trimeric intracellular cation channel family protein, partial [Amylibacter sp.]|nr:trimeric intracellular cation channel family protein [Amylibacter sp.]
QGELYITCAMSGAIVAVAANSFGMAAGLPLILCAGVCWGLRAGSIAFGWHLPVYKSRPPQE